VITVCIARGTSVAVAAISGVLFCDPAFGQIVVSQLVCNQGSMTSASAATCTIELSGTAPAGGIEVLLSSNNTLLPVPSSSLTVQAGAASATFTATAGKISTNQSATLTATAQYSVLLTWTDSRSPNVARYDVYRAITSGGPYSLLTTLGLVSTYRDYNVQNGEKYYYAVTAVNSSGEQSAYSGQAAAVVPVGEPKTAIIKLLGPVVLSSLSCSSTSLTSGTETTCTVTLSNPAPDGGVVVSLASSDTLLPVPEATVTVAAGSATKTFTATAGDIASNQSVTLTASLNGVSKTAIIKLLGPSSLPPPPPVAPLPPPPPGH
jgi:trimeric autotransporter adhesin